MPQGRPQVLWVQDEEWWIAKKKEKNKKQTSKLSNTYINKVDKKASTPYLLKKKNNKVVAIKVNKQTNNGAKRIWVPKKIISNMKSTKKVWSQKGSEKSDGLQGIWRLGKVWVHFMGCIIMDKVIAKWVSEYYGPKFIFPC